MVENAGNGESVESYYKQYTGAVRGGCACGGDDGAGCGGGDYGVWGRCSLGDRGFERCLLLALWRGQHAHIGCAAATAAGGAFLH